MLLLAAVVFATLRLALPSTGESDALADASADRHAVADTSAVAPGAVCPSPAAADRAAAALRGAEARFQLESEGLTIHRDLRQIAGDRRLLKALSANDLSLALAEANRQLVRHVVRIRVQRGPRIVVDANPSSFDVGGSGLLLRAPTGTVLGRLQITVQDVIGFDKLVHKLLHADVVVRGSGGHARTTLPAAAGLSLPAAGCARIGGRSYVVGSFAQRSFTGEHLAIWVLTPS